MRRIKKAREQKGLTREQLAERIGVSPSAIGKWETGDRTPSSDTLARLSEELGVSTDYLLELDNPSKDSEGARRIIEIAVDDPVSDMLLFWQSIKGRPDLRDLFKELATYDEEAIRRAARVIHALNDQQNMEG